MAKEPLSAEEVVLLGSLLDRLTWPTTGGIPNGIFHALMPKIVSVPIEPCVFNDDGQILLIPRPQSDPEYPGCHHSPGTVLRDNENVAQAIDRLVKGELGCPIGDLVRRQWREVPRGTGVGENPTRHEIALVHTCVIKGRPRHGQFFDLDNMPDNLLTHHREMIKAVVNESRPPRC